MAVELVVLFEKQDFLLPTFMIGSHHLESLNGAYNMIFEAWKQVATYRSHVDLSQKSDSNNTWRIARKVINVTWSLARKVITKVY